MRTGRIIAMVMLAGALGQAAELKGEVKVAGRNGNVPTYVWAEPLGGGAPVKPGHFTMKQLNKEITPHVLVVPVGSTVDFSNEDAVMHNIFSLTKPGAFDLGLYKTSKPVVFKNASTYRIFCNIHPQMTGVILVVPTSHITEAAPSGTYRLEVPAGKYRVTAWSEHAAAAAAVEVTVGGATANAPALALDESKYVELPHKNKFGKDYHYKED